MNRRFVMAVLAVLLCCLASGTREIHAAPVVVPAFGQFDVDEFTATERSDAPDDVSPFVDLSSACNTSGASDPFSESTLFIAANGTITGSCQSHLELSGYVGESKGTLSGTVNPATGAVTFEITATQTETWSAPYYLPGTTFRSVEIAGTGLFNADGKAPTRVQFEVNCRTTGQQYCTYPLDPADSLSEVNYFGFVDVDFQVAPLGPVDISIDHIEVVQVVQDANNSIPLVAEKLTMARVFVKSTVPVLGAFVTLTSNKPGTPESIDDNIVWARSTVDRNDINQSADFILPIPWTNGALQLDANVQPPPGVTEASPANNTKSVSVTFQQRQTLDIAYTKVCRKLPSDPQPVCPHGDVTELQHFAQGIFPIADGDLTYERIVTPPWIYEHPLDTAADENAFLVALRKRYDFAELNPGVTRSFADQVLAWLPEGLTIDGGASDPNWYDGTGQGKVLYVQKKTDPTFELAHMVAIAHEVAHNLGRRHPNREPSGCGAKDPGTDWTPPTAETGELGLWVEDKTLMLATSKDLMSYCSNRWMSPFTYTRLFETNFFPPTTAALQPAAETTVIIISGSARADGASGTLDPAYVVTSNSTNALPVSNAQGNHCLRFTGSGPQSDFCFSLSFQTSEEGDPLTSEAFSLKVPLPAGVTRVALRHGATELAAIQATASAPDVDITAPANGSTWTGNQAVTWAGSDADSNPLTYTVFYSADGGDSWLPVAVDTHSAQLSLNTDELQGSTNAMFRVVASDGLMTTVDTTAAITVGTPRVWGDVGCDGALDVGDVLKVRRAAAGLAADAPLAGCPAPGAGVTIATIHGEMPWGDVECDKNLGPADALGILRSIAGLTDTSEAGCPAVGAMVVPTPIPADL